MDSVLAEEPEVFNLNPQRKSSATATTLLIGPK